MSNPEANRCHGNAFSQTFASTVAGWYDFDPSTGIVPGTPTTIELQGGVAIIQAGSTHDGDKTAFTLWGGYSATFPQGGYNTEIEIYLDPVGAPDDTDFGYTSVINGTDCNANADSSLSLVHVGTNATGTKFCVGASAHDQDPCGDAALPVEITTADWYSFRHTFRKDGSNVVITIELRRGNTLLGAWPLTVAGTPGRQPLWLVPVQPIRGPTGSQQQADARLGRFAGETMGVWHSAAGCLDREGKDRDGAFPNASAAH